jgi:hypothetical protein
MFELLDVHNFDSVVEMCFFVLGFVDIAVLSLSYFLKQNIVLDHFIH